MRVVSRVIIHEDSFHSSKKKFTQPRDDANIALLIMQEPVQFTDYIQPICLPNIYERTYDVNGIIASYGLIDRSAVNNSPIPKEVKLRTFSYETCRRNLSPRTFCAKAENESSICLGRILIKLTSKLLASTSRYQWVWTFCQKRQQIYPFRNHFTFIKLQLHS